MKVAWLHSHFLYWLGGTKFVYEAVKRLRNRCKVKILVEASSALAKQKYASIGVELEDMLGISSNNSLYWLFFPYHLRKDCNRLGEEVGNFDVIISSMFPMNWVATRFARKTVQLCFEPYAFFHDKYMVNNFPFPKRNLLKLLRHLYARYDVEATQQADKVLTLNKYTAHLIKRVYNREAEITHQGVDTDFFKKKFDDHLNRKYSGYKIVFHSTDYTPIKGTDLVIRALPQVLREAPSCKLLISNTVTNAQKKKELIDLARRLNVRNNIDFVGFLDEEMLPCYYSMANVVIYAGLSGASTASLVVLEAMACETPVIRTASMEEEVIDGQSGFLVDPTDNNDLASAIVRILQDPNLEREMGLRGRDRVQRMYNWDKTASKIWQAIQR